VCLRQDDDAVDPGATKIKAKGTHARALFLVNIEAVSEPKASRSNRKLRASGYFRVLHRLRRFNPLLSLRINACFFALVHPLSCASLRSAADLVG
jgi:hypothetical protein